MSSGREQKPTPAEVSAGLRDQAFTVQPDQVGARQSPGQNSAWGLIMETGYPNGVASLVTFIDGTTSMYFSNGGGVIGAGEHAEVRNASKALLASVATYLKEFSPVAEHPLPGVGLVRFYARTFDGVLSTEAGENDLGEGRHRLSPLFHAGHRVIGHLRQISEKSRRSEPGG
jgi:hypothetical protein